MTADEIRRGTPGNGPISRDAALAACERIAERDRSNLYRVSLFLADKRRWDAFLAFYAAMRVIDDRVDGLADAGRLSPEALAREQQVLSDWQERLDVARKGEPRSEPLDVGLAEAFASFPVPREVWTDFLQAMAWDLRHDRFESPAEFLRYAKGATAAPTKIFVQLLASEPADGESGTPARYLVPNLGDGFDAAACGHDLGVFAYIGHILRDVVADLEIGPRGRIYIPLSDLREAGLTEQDLLAMAAAGQGDERWRACIRALVARAREFERRGVAMAEARGPALRPDCWFILTLIILLYQDLLDRIEADPDAPLRRDPIQGEAEKMMLASRAAQRCGFRPEPAIRPSPGSPGPPVVS